jgi:hypothetical protein
MMQYEFSSLFSSNNLKSYTCPSGDSGESSKTTPDQVLGSTTNKLTLQKMGEQRCILLSERDNRLSIISPDPSLNTTSKTPCIFTADCSDLARRVKSGTSHKLF